MIIALICYLVLCGGYGTYYNNKVDGLSLPQVAVLALVGPVELLILIVRGLCWSVNIDVGYMYNISIQDVTEEDDENME